jgi:two-component system, OmpR family, phosphate regulon response regulator PhoB
MRTHDERLVMIVEDEPDVAQLIAYHLRRHGFRTVTALSGDEAQTILTKHRPDFAILDVMLPGKDGMELCREIKSSPETRHMPVILLTALTATSDKLRGFGCGADDYLTKPFSIFELIVRVFAQLRRSPAAAAA